MGLTLVAVAIIAGAQMDNPLLFIVAALSAAATIGKLALMAWQRRLSQCASDELANTRRSERLHQIATLIMAVCVAATASPLFLHIGVEWHVLATALLFAYCAGVVARLSIWPSLAMPALLTATVPVIVVSAIWDDTPHRVTSLMFAIFLFGSIETVRHVHRRAVKHIAAELDLATLARNDPLTGLSNRLGFREAFRAATTEGAGRLAVHCLDLDGFKGVNDRLGHAGGDVLLVQVARRIAASAPDAAVARLGGDEFAILQRRIDNVGQATALADAVIGTLRRPFDVEGKTVVIGASLGYAIAKPDAANFDMMLRTADAASYRMKRAGGGVAIAGSQDVAPWANQRLSVPA